MIFLAVLLLVGFGFWRAKNASPTLREWQGYAEADFVKVGPTQAGLLTSLGVARGDRVEAGSPLFAQDETDDLAGRDQAARQLRQAQEQLANLEQGAKPTEIDQAEANLADARATLDRMQQDFSRAQDLIAKGAITYQTLDQRRADQLSAKARVNVMEAALAQARAPMGRDREIRAAHAAEEASKAALAMAEWRLAQRRVIAPAAGRIADVLARPGEVLSIGAPVVSLLPPENIFVRFFVAEADLPSLHRGDLVKIVCDHCPRDFDASISFIAPQAEYTPPVIYSDSTREKLVYMVEARPPPERASLLNPGQPVTVRPISKAGGS
jgi:HlyD family secretion protein